MSNIKFKDYHIEQLKNNEGETEKYLNIALEEFFKDGNKKAFYQALQDVVEAKGGITVLSKKAELNRSNLYKIFSGKSKPKLETIENILSSLGFTFTIKHS